jgi:hypothetical protein
MWIALWVILSAFILTVFFWSVQILQQQKRAWSAYAKKNGAFTYTRGKMMESPSLRGGVKGMTMALYTDIQRTNDLRGQRFVTVIEVEIGSGMLTGGILATRELEPFVASLNFSETYRPEENWDPSYLVKTRSAALLKNYLTPARAEAIQGLFSMKNSVSLFFFDEQDAVLRMETPNPLKNVALLEKIINKVAGLAENLKPSEEEKMHYQQVIAERPAVQPEQIPAAATEDAAVVEAAERAAAPNSEKEPMDRGD